MPLVFSNETLFTNVSAEFSELPTTAFWEETSGEYSVEFYSLENTRIPSSAFVSATLTLVDEETHSVVNGRNAQDIFGNGSGANDVIFLEYGKLVWRIQPEDTQIYDTTETKRLENHIAIFRLTFDTGGGNETVQRVIKIPILKTFSLGNDPVDPGSNGIVVRIATDSYTYRVVESVTDVITVTNGDGVTGNIKIDLPGTGNPSDTLRGDGTWAPVSGAGLGDVTGPPSSVDGEAVLFSGTTGKVLRRFSGNGVVTASSGVVTTLAFPGDPERFLDGTGSFSNPSSSNVTESLVIAYSIALG